MLKDMAGDHKVGQGVRVLRQCKGWTLEELSSRCGLSISFLSQVERGLSSLSIPSLHSICEALKVPTTLLSNDDDERCAGGKGGGNPTTVYALGIQR